MTTGSQSDCKTSVTCGRRERKCPVCEGMADVYQFLEDKEKRIPDNDVVTRDVWKDC